MKKTIFSLAIMLVLLAGCKKQDNNDPKQPETPVVKPTITINVTRTGCNDIEFTTECSDSTVTYYVYGMTKAKYDVESVYSKDSIMGFEKSWYNQVAASTGQLWYEVMLTDCFKGKHSFKFTDFTSIIEPETELVIYAYGIDNKGNRVTYIHTKNVTTAQMNVSENQISVNITEVYANGVDADFTTTNNDTYYISLQKKSYVEYYQGEDHTMGEMATNLLVSELTNGGFIPLQSGNHSITPSEYSCKSKNTDYYLIYFSYDADYGRRSEVHLEPFHTAAE